MNVRENMSRKALCIGINKYKNHPLKVCVNDASEVTRLLEKNEDGSKNFTVKSLLDKEATRANMRKAIRELFKNSDDIALLYFSGHGVADDNDGFIVSCDYKEDDYGLSMPEIIKFAIKSKCKHKIVIFDCCNAGFAGTSGIIGDQSVLSDGTIILTASRKDEAARIKRGATNSVFTQLFLQALEGTASDIFGNTSPSSIYAFIDKALGEWDQRPFFKSSVESFISLRQNKPKIDINVLKRISNHFYSKNRSKKLDPSYEKTNYAGSMDRTLPPYKNEANCEIFEDLLAYYKTGLIEPVEETNMYETAMKSKHCRLTKLGQYYYDLVKSQVI